MYAYMPPSPLSEKLSAQITKIERVVRTDLSYLAAGGSWLALNQVGIALISLAVSIAFAHFVSKEAYGTYRFLLSVFWILTAFSLSGIPTAVTQAVARGFEGAYQKGFALSLLWSIPLFLIAAGTSVYYFANGNAVLGWGAVIIALLGPLIQPSFLYGAFLEGKRDFRLMTIFGILLNAFSAVLLCATMLVTQNPLAFVAAYLLGNIIPGIGFYYLTRHLYRPNQQTNPEVTLLSLHFSAMNFLATISQQIDKLLIFHYLGAAQLAVYSFAIAVPEQVKSAINSVSNLAFPKFAQRSIREIMHNLWRRMWIFTAAMAAVTVGYLVFARLGFEIVFPRYLDSVFYSQVYAVSLLFISNTIPPTILQAHAAKKELYIFNIATPIVQIAALVFFTIGYGLLGAVVARIVSRFFNLVLGTWLVRSYAQSAPEPTQP